jgi:hypothetical protein
VFAVVEIAMENTDALPPAHSVPTTKAAYLGRQRRRAPRVPLACLARFAAWQSLCTGHIAPQWKSRHLTNSDRQHGGSRCFRRPASERSLSSLDTKAKA